MFVSKGLRVIVVRQSINIFHWEVVNSKCKVESNGLYKYCTKCTVLFHSQGLTWGEGGTE